MIDFLSRLTLQLLVLKEIVIYRILCKSKNGSDELKKDLFCIGEVVTLNARLEKVERTL